MFDLVEKPELHTLQRHIERTGDPVLHTIKKPFVFLYPHG